MYNNQIFFDKKLIKFFKQDLINLKPQNYMKNKILIATYNCDFLLNIIYILQNLHKYLITDLIKDLIFNKRCFKYR